MQAQPHIKHKGSCHEREVFVLRCEEVDAAWPQVAPLLAKIDQWEYGLDEVRVMLYVKEAMLWGLIDASNEITAVWVTRIDSTRTAKWGMVWLAAGDGVDAIVDAFEAHTVPYFRGWGCQRVRIVGRPGWERALPGFKREAVQLVREIEPCH